MRALFFLIPALALTLISTTSCSTYYKGPQSDHFDGERFFHKWPEEKKTFFTLLKWQLTSVQQPWPKFKSIPTQSIEKTSDQDLGFSITFINHSTVYIQQNGVRYITDPQWAQRASPFSFAGPKRIFSAGVNIEQLPGLDFVIVSHNHYDHFDIETLKKLKELYNPTFYIPLGDLRLISEINSDKVVEMDWWDKKIIKNETEITFVPVKHWSARGLFDRNKSLWGGYIIKNKSGVLFFAGDTGYCSIFTELKNKYKNIDVSLLPIGAYEPRWFMKDAHMNPEEAVQAHIDLNSNYSVGIHWGLWPLTDEGPLKPLQDLKIALDKLKVSTESFVTFELGETKYFKSSNEQK